MPLMPVSLSIDTPPARSGDTLLALVVRSALRVCRPRTKCIRNSWLVSLPIVMKLRKFWNWS